MFGLLLFKVGITFFNGLEKDETDLKGDETVKKWIGKVTSNATHALVTKTLPKLGFWWQSN